MPPRFSHKNDHPNPRDITLQPRPDKPGIKYNQFNDVVVDHDKQTATEYGGTIRLDNSAYRVQFLLCAKSTKTKTKSFSIKTPNAYTAAVNFKHTESDRLGYSRVRPATFPELNKIIPDDIKQFISGFLDGDGTIGIYGHKIYIRFMQSKESGVPPILTFIQERYGGGLHAFSTKRNANTRRKHHLTVAGSHAIILLQDLSKYAILKSDQASHALQYYQCKNKEQRILLTEKIKQCKKDYASVPIDSSRITNAYIAGLFDAEGYVGFCGNSARLEIAQKQCIPLLEAVATFINLPYYMKQKALNYCAISAYSVIRMIHHWLIMKKSQTTLMLEHDRIKTDRRCKGEKRRVGQDELDIAAEVKRLKRL
jgi:hypothetical protein